MSTTEITTKTTGELLAYIDEVGAAGDTEMVRTIAAELVGRDEQIPSWIYDVAEAS